MPVILVDLFGLECIDSSLGQTFVFASFGYLFGAPIFGLYNVKLLNLNKIAGCAFS